MRALCNKCKARVFHVTHLCATWLKAVTVSCIRRRHHVRGNHNSLSRPVGACTAIEVSLLHHAAVCVCVWVDVAVQATGALCLLCAQPHRQFQLYRSPTQLHGSQADALRSDALPHRET